MVGSSFHHFLTPLLILLTFTTNISSTSAARATPGEPRSIEFIKTSCSSTTYPSLCYHTLSTHASDIQTSPQLLAHTALAVTLNNTQSTSAMMAKMLQSRAMSPREMAAMRDCVEELGDSVDLLRKSLGEMSQLKGSNFYLKMDDIQTWVSAAMTNEDTCTEGFSERSSAAANSNLKNVVRGQAADSNVKNVVRGQVVNIAHMTSNALALVNSLAPVHR
jgi:pectinesterase inhibitor-like protein